MIPRRLRSTLPTALAESPAVALLGPRQVGKTTLALQAAASRPSPIYLNLESESDAAKLAEPEFYLGQHENNLVSLDEIQRIAGRTHPPRSSAGWPRRSSEVFNTPARTSTRSAASSYTPATHVSRSPTAWKPFPCPTSAKS